MADRRLAAALAAPETGIAGVSTAFRADPGGLHIGALIDLLRRTGIDATRWSAAAVKRELDADGAQSHMSWCSSPSSALGYLAWRLARIDWTKPSPHDVLAASRARVAAQLESRPGRFTPTASEEHPLRVAIRQAALVDSLRQSTTDSVSNAAEEPRNAPERRDPRSPSSRAVAWRSFRRSTSVPAPSAPTAALARNERHTETSQSDHRARLRVEWRRMARSRAASRHVEEDAMT